MMVSKQLLKDYDFENIEEYYLYIDKSEENGQRSQVRNLINSLSIKQKVDAVKWMEERISCNYNNKCTEDVKELLLNSIRNN